MAPAAFLRGERPQREQADKDHQGDRGTVAVERVHSLAPPPNGARSALQRVTERRCRRSSAPFIRQPSQTTAVWGEQRTHVGWRRFLGGRHRPGPSQPTTGGTNEQAGLKDWVSDPARSSRPQGCTHAPAQGIPGRSSRQGRSGKSRPCTSSTMSHRVAPNAGSRRSVGFPPLSHGPSRYRGCRAAERVTSRPATMDCALVWSGQAFVGRGVGFARQRCGGRCGNARRGVRPRSTQGLE